MRGIRRWVACVAAAATMTAMSTHTASASDSIAPAGERPRIQALQLHVAGTTPLITVVADREIIDADTLEALDVMAQLDLMAMMEQIRADTMAELGEVPIPDDVLALIDGPLAEQGIDLGPEVTNMALLDTMQGLAADVAGDGPDNPAAGAALGPAAGAALTWGLVIVLVVGSGYLLYKGVSALKESQQSGGGDVDTGTGDGTGETVPPGETDAGAGESEPEETPESLRAAADDNDASAEYYDRQAKEAGERGDSEAQAEAEANARTMRELAAEKRARAAALEKKQSDNESADPDNMGTQDRFWAYLLALNPGLAGTEYDKTGQALQYMAAHGAGERPVHSNPVPIDDGSGGIKEVEVTTVGCIGPGCGLVDPTEDTRKVSISPSMMERVLAVHTPGGMTVSYPPLDGEPAPGGEPGSADGGSDTGGSPGAGCEFC